MLMFAVNAFTTFVLSSELPTFVNPRLQLQVIFQTLLFYKPFPPTWPLISYIPLFYLPLLSPISLPPAEALKLITREGYQSCFRFLNPPFGYREGKAHSSFFSCHICTNEPERVCLFYSEPPLSFISRKTTHEKASVGLMVDVHVEDRRHWNTFTSFFASCSSPSLNIFVPFFFNFFILHLFFCIFQGDALWRYK